MEWRRGQRPGASCRLAAGHSARRTNCMFVLGVAPWPPLHLEMATSIAWHRIKEPSQKKIMCLSGTKAATLPQLRLSNKQCYGSSSAPANLRPDQARRSVCYIMAWNLAMLDQITSNEAGTARAPSLAVLFRPISGAAVGWLLSLALLNIQTGLVLMIPTLALASVGSYSNLEHPPPTLPAASSFQPWMSLPPTNVPISDVPSSDVPIFSEVSIINCLGQRIASANCQVPWHKLSTASANEMPRHKSSSASAQIILCTRLPSKKGSRFNIRPRKGARGLIIHNSSCGATRGQRGSRSARRTIENIRGIDAFICTHNINADAYTLLYTSASANMLPTFAVHGVCMGKLNRRTVVCLGTTSIQPSCASAHDPPSCASAQDRFNRRVPRHTINRRASAQISCASQHRRRSITPEFLRLSNGHRIRLPGLFRVLLTLCSHEVAWPIAGASFETGNSGW